MKKLILLLMLLGMGVHAQDVERLVWNFPKDTAPEEMYLLLKEYALSGKKPDDVQKLRQFQWTDRRNAAVNADSTWYAHYFRAVLKPAKTDVYLFRFSSTGLGELRISATGTRGKMADLAWVDAENGVPPGNYGKSGGQTSKKIRLEANREYFIEAFGINRMRPDGHLSFVWTSAKQAKKQGKVVPPGELASVKAEK